MTKIPVHSTIDSKEKIFFHFLFVIDPHSENGSELTKFLKTDPKTALNVFFISVFTSQFGYLDFIKKIVNIFIMETNFLQI